MRKFVGIDLGREGAQNETTVCKFRHLLEEHELGKRLFEEVGPDIIHRMMPSVVHMPFI
jgi:IS5 family transposase